MHYICIYHIPKGLNFKNIFEFFTTKLLLKEQTYVFLKNPFFGHISVNFCPILKIFGTVTIRKTRSLSWAHLLIDQMNISQISIMDTKSFIGILRPLSLMSANLGIDRLWGLKSRFFILTWSVSKCAQLKDLVFLIVMVPKIFKIGQKLTEIWPKNGFFKYTYICSFSSNLIVKNSKKNSKIESFGYVTDTYEMHIFWRFVVDTSKIGRFIGKKAQKLDSTPIISIQDFH